MPGCGCKPTFWLLVLFPSPSRACSQPASGLTWLGPRCPRLRSLVAPGLGLRCICFYFIIMKMMLVCQRKCIMYEKA